MHALIAAKKREEEKMMNSKTERGVINVNEGILRPRSYEREIERKRNKTLQK